MSNQNMYNKERRNKSTRVTIQTRKKHKLESTCASAFTLRVKRMSGLLSIGYIRRYKPKNQITCQSHSLPLHDRFTEGKKKKSQVQSLSGSKIMEDLLQQIVKEAQSSKLPVLKTAAQDAYGEKFNFFFV